MNNLFFAMSVFGCGGCAVQSVYHWYHSHGNVSLLWLAATMVFADKVFAALKLWCDEE